MLKLPCSRKMTTEAFTWSKISQWDRQISTSSCKWGVNWSLQQKTSVESKTGPQLLMPTKSNDMDEQQQLAHTLVDVLERASWKIWVTLLSTMWKNRRVHMLKSDFLQGRRRTRNFGRLFLWNLDVPNLSIYLI